HVTGVQTCALPILKSAGDDGGGRSPGAARPRCGRPTAPALERPDECPVAGAGGPWYVRSAHVFGRSAFLGWIRRKSGSGGRTSLQRSVRCNLSSMRLSTDRCEKGASAPGPQEKCRWEI